MYVVTGSHVFVRAGSHGRSSNSVDGYRRKYHAESRNVSETSVSRRPVAPHCGHFTKYHSLCRASGLTPLASGRKSSMKGSSTGRSRSGTATGDRKSTRLNSSHGYISYAVFCLKKKKKSTNRIHQDRPQHCTNTRHTCTARH